MKVYLVCLGFEVFSFYLLSKTCMKVYLNREFFYSKKMMKIQKGEDDDSRKMMNVFIIFSDFFISNKNIFKK
jgi:hypothetical protein